MAACSTEPSSRRGARARTPASRVATTAAHSGVALARASPQQCQRGRGRGSIRRRFGSGASGARRVRAPGALLRCIVHGVVLSATSIVKHVGLRSVDIDAGIVASPTPRCRPERLGTHHRADWGESPAGLRLCRPPGRGVHGPGNRPNLWRKISGRFVGEAFAETSSRAVRKTSSRAVSREAPFAYRASPGRTDVCWKYVGEVGAQVGLVFEPPAASVRGGASFGELRAGLAMGARRREFRAGLAVRVGHGELRAGLAVRVGHGERIGVQWRKAQGAPGLASRVCARGSVRCALIKMRVDQLARQAAPGRGGEGGGRSTEECQFNGARGRRVLGRSPGSEEVRMRSGASWKKGRVGTSEELDRSEQRTSSAGL